MAKIDKELAAEMRREGKTFREIGKYFGVSHQAVADILTNSVRARKGGKTIEMIPYKGLYEYMMAHKMLTITRLTKIMYGRGGHAEHEKVLRFLQGRNVQFPKRVYDNLIAHTGMTYEQLFELREGFKEGNDG